MKQKILFISAIVLAAIFSARAAEPYMLEPFSPSGGLCSMTVPQILQDSKGFMWFGTPDGIDRYDGYEILHIRIPEDCSGYGNVRTFCEDNNGNIWIGSFKGICVWDSRRQTVRKYSEGSVSRIIKSRDGALWVAGNYAGFLRIDPQTGVCDTLRFEYHNASAHFGDDVSYDGEYTIWFLNGVGAIYKCSLDSRKLDVVVPYHESPLHRRNITRFHYIDGFLVGGRRATGGFVYDTVSGEFHTIGLGDFFSAGKLVGGGDFLSTEDGLLFFPQGIRENLKKPLDAGNRMVDFQVITVCVDRDGSYWLGTNEDGVFRLIPNKISLETLGTGFSVSDIEEGPDHSLWIGTREKGLLHYSPEKGILEKSSFPGESVSALAFVGDTLVVTTSSPKMPVALFDTKTFNIKVYRGFPVDLSVALPHGGQNVWGGGWLQNLDLKEGRYGRIEVVRTTIMDIMEDSAGRFWVATSFGGVWMEDKGEWTHYTDSVGVVMRTTALYGDDKYIWICSPDDGLQRLDPKTGETRLYTQFGGVNCQRITAVAADSQNYLWLSSPQGFAVLEPDSGNSAFYSTQDGLEVGQSVFSILKSVDGMMYVGNHKGLVRFDPAAFKEILAQKGRIVFTSFALLDRLGKMDGESPREGLLGIDGKKGIKLKFNENSFRVGVSQMDFGVPRSTTLEFRLMGYDDKWLVVKDGHITFTGIPPGHYKLCIRLSGRSGAQLVDTRMLDITVARPVWASVPAFILYFIILSGGIILLVAGVRRREFRKAAEASAMESWQREAEREKRLYASKVEFLTTIAHEIRTPLTLVKAPVETLQAKLSRSADKSVVEDLEVVSRNADKLSVLLDELLDFRKLENSAMNLNLAEYDIDAIVRSAFGRFSLAARRKGIVMDLSLPSEGVSAAVDKNALDKIVSNLVSNALKYGKSTVRLTLENAGDNFRIIIENDGEIVPPEERERIFRPFERFVSSESMETGTGIGLFVSRNLAELHNGTLEMDVDTSVNRFILTIPIAHIAQEAVPDKSVSDIHIPQGRPVLLIVEDSAEMLSFLERQCSGVYDVITASNGAEALKIIESNPLSTPDCIISDVMMPEMDGYELCRNLKENERTSHIPLILLTALGDANSRMTGLDFGADAYLSKPFSSGELLTVVANLLKNRERLRKKYSSLPSVDYDDIASSSQDARLLQTIDAYIHEHIADESLGVEALAERACVSTSTLFKKMKHLLGFGPSDYIIKVRLNQASTLLRSTSIPIAEIATRTGFRSPSYFSACFKSQFGVTPKEYRNSF